MSSPTPPHHNADKCCRCGTLFILAYSMLHFRGLNVCVDCITTIVKEYLIKKQEFHNLKES